MNFSKANGLFICLFLSCVSLLAQTGTIKGRIFDPINNESILFANIVIEGTATGATSDLEGNYEIGSLEPGLYNIEASYVGYETARIFEIRVSNSRVAFVDIPMEQRISELDAVVIKSKNISRTAESPVSLRSIGADEIARAAGGNRDISKVVQNLPGVATTPSFRNDILIRGGSPAENVFYLDGIEIPVINHFSTQGASGGPNGMINVDFLRDVDFYAGAFPVNRGDALSSVFDFQFKDGNTDKTRARFTIGSSDAGITLDGPIGEKTTYLASARRSYFQFLASALELPFLPVYNDFQFKTKTQLDKRNTLTFLGIGAIDDFTLNLDANETEEQRNFLDRIPVNNQWNYTIGAKYTHFWENSYTNVIVSRSHLDNTAYKYVNNDETDPDGLILDYNSNEIENKIRIENVSRKGGFKITAGINAEQASTNTNSFVKRPVNGELFTVDYLTSLSFLKYGLFAQASKNIFNERLTVSAGFRADGASYSSETQNLLKQFSPRVSLGYNITESISLNANAGIYYQLPPYTILAYRENGDLVNKNNGIKYIGNKHLVGGIEWSGNSNSRITVEGFYKIYDDYPFLLNDSISFANLGGDFGVSGDEPMVPTSEGRTYGAEFLFQQKIWKGFYGIAAYTYSFSEFKDKFGDYAPTAWDGRHIINLTGGKRFARNWELGLRFRYSSGVPYSPFDVVNSSQVAIWDATGEGIPNYDLLNTERLSGNHQMDIRIDKRWYYNKWNLQLYLDIENLYGASRNAPPDLYAVLDEEGNKVFTDENETNYQLKEVPNSSGVTLPSIGVVVEF